MSNADGSRRALLTHGLPGLAREALRRHRALRATLLEAAVPRPDEPDERHEPELPWASPARRLVTLNDLRALLAEHDLEGRAADVSALAKVSIRLVPSDPAERDPGTETPAGGELRAFVDLRDPVIREHADALPACDGALLIRCRGDEEARGAVRAQARLDQASPRGHSVCGLKVHASPELVIPRAWSEPVESLGLSERERDGWSRLRETLAERQGVSPSDSTERTHLLHRLLGYPDDRTGSLLPPQDRMMLFQFSTDEGSRAGVTVVTAGIGGARASVKNLLAARSG